MAQSIEHEFHAIGNAQLVVNPQQRLLHRILFEVQFASDFAVVQALGDQMDSLFLPRSKYHVSA